MKNIKFGNFEEMLLFNAAHYGGDVAFVFDEDGQKKNMTHGQFYDKVYARKKEFEGYSENCLGIFEEYGIKWAIDFFASVLSGKQTVLIDASTGDDVLSKIVAYADVARLICDDVTSDAAESVILSSAELKKAEGEGDVLFFTSGTTASAKAVVLTSQSLCASAWNGQEKLPCRKDDTLLCVLPLCHVFGFVCSLLWPLSQGATVAFGRGLGRLTVDCGYFTPTVISLVPTMLYFMLGKGAFNSELRVILVGAGPASKEALAVAEGKGYEVHFGYGLTETSSGVAISTGDDPYKMDVCADDEITVANDGEILVSAPTCLMKGYYKLPSDTAEVVKNGVLHTGDLGVFVDGKLTVTGRKKDIIALPNGNKIYLPEWEEQLKNALGVQEVAILLRDGKITAVCVDKTGASDGGELQGRLDAFNADKPFDRQITALEIRKEELPKTAVGKLKRWCL